MNFQSIVIGKTNKKAIITVCVNCTAYSYRPHFNYISKKQHFTISLISAELVDDMRNIELADRTDIEEFLNKKVDIKDIVKTKRIIKKWNKKFVRENRKTSENKDRYIIVNDADIEKDMTYWELIIKLWNKHNEQKTPRNLMKPYYRNLQEYIDSACFINIGGGKCYTQQDQEKRPHFIYELKTGEKFGILLEKAEYLFPISRKLTQQELDVLVKLLNAPVEENYKIKNVKNNWEFGILLWNSQNYNYNKYSSNWFVKYKKINENTTMPDYTKLNN